MLYDPSTWTPVAVDTGNAVVSYGDVQIVYGEDAQPAVDTGTDILTIDELPDQPVAGTSAQ